MKKQVTSTTTKSAKSKAPKAAIGRVKASAKVVKKTLKLPPARLLETQEREHAVRIKTAIDKVSTAIMMVDRNFIVTYVNDTTRQMLVKHAEHFRGLWPAFTPEGIMGACIDVFHKNPAHQRGMLADPKNLPHRTDITVGPLRFSLCVNASYDTHGTYNGNILEWADVTEIRKQEAQNNDYAGQIAAISKSQAVVEFHMDGTIFSANQNYLNVSGFTLDEIIGKHHSVVVEESERRSSEYRDFWASLNRGEYQTGEYKRLGRNGREIWLQASYNPILDLKGKPFKVVKYATDITQEKLKAVDIAGQIAAIGQTMSMIEFNMDGIVQNANNNFLSAMGYTLDEIRGKHHVLFVEESYKHSDEYRQFWEGLKRGEAQNRQCKRIRRNGSTIWLQASYNPILDLNGRPFKVLKFATDITVEKTREEQLSRAMAETSRVMQAVAVGDLSDSMQGTFEGEFAKLRDSVNSCTDNLRRMMAETGRVMKGLAGGDLRNSIEGTYEGEFGELSDSVNSCVENLRKTVEQIRHSVSTMTTSSAEIASGNMDLSQRTEEQASSLTLTAANMEEITQTVKQNADNARQADLLAGSARDQAEKGGTVVKNAIAAMGSINEASNRIADIIGVIDEIAFQTNLLALNAAVEAARAGEQGRGFAVVAAEVRNLAQRSAGAAKEIKGLIKDSVIRVEEGSRLVNESGSTLESIVQAAKKVSDIIAEIAAASTQQSAGIEKVTEAVQQMDAAVQQNSALVEETSAASNMMDDQAQSMSNLIDFFKLAGNSLLTSATSRPATRTKPAAGSRAPQRTAQPKKPLPNSRPAFDAQPEFTMADEF